MNRSVQAKDLILEQFPSLSPSLQSAARYVLDHQHEVVVSSMRTIAERAGAQPATFVRLAQQLGYGGWGGLKDAVVADMGLLGDSYGQRAKSLTERSSRGGLIDEMRSALTSNLASSYEKSSSKLSEAADMLRTATAVHVAGYRASSAIAYSLFYGYRLFRSDVHLLDGAHGGLQWQLRAIREGHVVVVVSFAPYSSEILQVLEAVKAAGAKAIALTDSHASPLALACDLTLLFDTDSPSFFPSIAAAIAMTESLLELIVASEGAHVPEAMERAEQALFASGAYLKDSR